jgi:N-glycosylase/DNA lyase
MQSKLREDPSVLSMVKTVRELTRNPRIKTMVDERMDEFRRVHGMDSKKWYEELVYCLLTAYSSALMGQRCVDALLRNGTITEGELRDVQSCLIGEGHRFANTRAEYIYKTRHLAPKIKSIIQGFGSSAEARKWLVANIKGFGWKEASHYLRNVGYFDLAIIDRHILSNMAEHGLITLEDERKSLTRRRYLAYEEKLAEVADMLGLSPGELDLYLWYRKTGKVLK